MYKIEFKPAAQRDLRKLASHMPRTDWERLKAAIDSLANTPFSPGSIKLSGSDLYRLRSGDYRVIYSINSAEHTVTITKVARRSESTYRE